jgi:hypothetical protein
MFKVTLVVGLALLGPSVYPGVRDSALDGVNPLVTLLAAGFGFSLLVAVICDLKRLRKNRPPMPPGAKKPIDLPGGFRSALLMAFVLLAIRLDWPQQAMWGLFHGKYQHIVVTIQPGETVMLEGGDRWAGPYRVERADWPGGMR